MNRNDIVVANNYTVNQLGSEAMVTSEEMEDILIVNEFGSDVLKFILSKKEVCVNDIISEFEKTYSSETLEKDIKDFIQKMNENGVVRL